MKQLLSLLAVLCLLAGGANAQSKPKFDINKATATEIAANLEGVGPKKAAAIVAYRKKHGALETTDDLLQVPGLGPVLVAKNVKALGLERGALPLDAKSKGKAKNARARAGKARSNLEKGARKKAAAVKAKPEAKAKPSPDAAKKPAKAKKREAAKANKPAKRKASADKPKSKSKPKSKPKSKSKSKPKSKPKPKPKPKPKSKSKSKPKTKPKKGKTKDSGKR